MSAFHGILDFCIRMLPGVLFGAIIFFLSRPNRMKKLRALSFESPPLREVSLLLFFIFCSGLAVLTLTPRWFHWNSLFAPPQGNSPSFFSFGTANLIPFRTFQSDPWSLMILIGNIIMFVPFGLFPSLFSGNFRLSKALLWALFLPLFVECSQLLVGRSFDVDDLILNTSGILLGRIFFSSLPECFVSRFRPQPLK